MQNVLIFNCYLMPLMQLPNLDQKSYYKEMTDDDAALVMNRADFSWQNSVFQLRDLNVHLKKGQLIGVIGQVGSGKTAFLQAIIGDMIKLNGEISINNEKGLIIIFQMKMI